MQILKSAQDDLIEGFHFYEESRAGLGDYSFRHSIQISSR